MPGRIEIHDGSTGRPRLARATGQPPTGNPVVDRAFDNAQRFAQHLQAEYGRDRWTASDAPLPIVVDWRNARGEPMPQSTVDHRVLMGTYFQDGQAIPYSDSFEYLAHEISHWLLRADNPHWAQTGGFPADESWADVLPVLAGPDWVMGDDITVRGKPPAYAADLRHPRYVRVQDLPTSQVEMHAVGRIASLAAVRAADVLGRPAVGRIWYRAMTRFFPDRFSSPRPAPGVDKNGTFAFPLAALATLDAAAELHGANSRELAAVRDAWRSVGVDPAWP